MGAGRSPYARGMALRWGDDRREVQRLAAVLAGDAVFDSYARQWVEDDLDRLQVSQDVFPIIVAAKSAATVGLLVGLRRRPIGYLASLLLVVYFGLAVGAHARVRDEPLRWLPAIGMLVWCVRVHHAFRGGELTKA